MSVGQARLLRKRMPSVYALIRSGKWEIAGATGKGHLWIRHKASGRRVVAPSSASDVRSERNLLTCMSNIEKGIT